MTHGPPIFVGIDPGRSKCGYALADERGARISIDVVPTAALLARLSDDAAVRAIRAVCVGHATTSENVVRSIRLKWPDMPLAVVDETNTTLEARHLYHEDHPPRGLMRFIPRGLLVPAADLDGYAALLIVRRYLAHRLADDGAVGSDHRESAPPVLPS